MITEIATFAASANEYYGADHAHDATHTHGEVGDGVLLATCNHDQSVAAPTWRA
jgi:hypothetical protein